MYSIFKDPELRAQFARDGYITMPWLSAQELTPLKSLFEEVKSKVSLQGFATTTTSPDLELKAAMFEEVDRIYRAKVDAVFQNYKPLGASFLQKDPGSPGSLPLHQDWTVTEEDHFRTFTIWLPLEDCGLENGAIQMLPGSHQWTNILRGPNLPVAMRGASAVLEQDLVTLELKAGEALIFDHSIFHKSTLNLSDRPRVALTYGLAQQEAPLRFWYQHPGDPVDRLEQIAVPDDFFLRYHQIGQRPSIGQSLGFYRHDLSAVTPAQGAAMRDGQKIRRSIYRDLSAKNCLLDQAVCEITQHADWNQALADKGFVQFPLLDAQAVAQLKQFFELNQTDQVDRFYASVHNPSTAFRRAMDFEIQSVVSPLLAEILNEGIALGASFIAKPKGKTGILPPHADWNIVDERQYRSYNLWIPLVDTTLANGAIHVIPGSHNWLDYYRGPGIPNPFEPHQALIWRAMQALEIKAGTALLYDHRLLHASPTNQTDALRLACVMGIKPKSAAMRYYHGDGQSIKAYVANPAFFMEQNPELGPHDLELWADEAAGNPMLSASDVYNYLGWEAEGAAEEPEAPAVQMPQPKPRGFWQTYTPSNIWKELKWRLRGR